MGYPSLNNALSLPCNRTPSKSDDQNNAQPFLRTVTEVQCSATVVSTTQLRCKSTPFILQSRPKPVYRATTYPQHERTLLFSPAPFRVTNTRAHVTRSPDPLYTTSPAQAVNPRSKYFSSAYISSAYWHVEQAQSNFYEFLALLEDATFPPCLHQKRAVTCLDPEAIKRRPQARVVSPLFQSNIPLAAQAAPIEPVIFLRLHFVIIRKVLASKVPLECWKKMEVAWGKFRRIRLEPTARVRSLFSPLQFPTKDTSLVSLVLAEQPLVMELPLVSPASCDSRWVREFKNSRTDVHDEPRAGRPSDSYEIIAKVEAAMLEDRRVTVRKLCHLVPDISKTTIDKILREHLGYSKNERRGMLTKGVRFHHDNARPHTAHKTTAFFEEFGWELVSHPPYSPNLASSDFHFLPELKKNLGGTQFQDDDELEEAVLGLLRGQAAEFFDSGFHKWNPKKELDQQLQTNQSKKNSVNLTPVNQRYHNFLTGNSAFPNNKILIGQPKNFHRGVHQTLIKTLLSHLRDDEDQEEIPPIITPTDSNSTDEDDIDIDPLDGNIPMEKFLKALKKKPINNNKPKKEYLLGPKEFNIMEPKTKIPKYRSLFHTLICP
ncbi:hypothetical protein LAZ67_6003068 [Cordylochernes scorpioides]|uniref:Transposase n=1 Tax=Cordylochernes scorpioides TaxID=51811 RepID=A0ABY6KN73_9ARAC|nr:hypothetical protein LAZ67_6003068 [Cordylochernes scorpioides]